MLPFLTYPLALIALATVPALTAIYLLRNRQRRRQVSSLVLWQFQVQSKAGGARVQRLQLPFLFFLELLVLLFLVVAATGPQWKLPQSTRPLVVVLDDSFSMRATAGTASAQQTAQNFLTELFRHQPPPSTRLVLAGREVRTLGGAVKTFAELQALLAGWKCSSPNADLDAALTLAFELGQQQANVLVLTDHAPADEKIANPRLRWAAFGAGLDNVAIVNASRTAFGGEDRCLLEIANHSPRPCSVPLTTHAGTNAPQMARLTLGARETQRVVFNLPAEGGDLAAALPTDALLTDNSVVLLPPHRRRVRVQVSLADESAAALFNRTLDATGLRSTISDKPELLVTSGTGSAGTNGWTLRLSGLDATNAYAGPFIVDNSHPLAPGLGLSGTIWAAAAATNVPGEVPVILAGNLPLLSVGETAPGCRLIRLNFNPALSTLPGTPDWPVLLWNILSWRLSEMPGLAEANVRLGTPVSLKTAGEAVAVTSPDGVVRNFSKTGGELALETPVPGIYSVVSGAGTNRFAANVLAADESDLATTVAGEWGKWSEELEHRLVESSVGWLFGLLALGLLGLHLWLVAATKGGR